MKTAKEMFEELGLEQVVGKKSIVYLDKRLNSNGSSYSTFAEIIYGKPFTIITKPKLTEAERVILENISKEYKIIARSDNGFLGLIKYIFLSKSNKEFHYFKHFNHLFTFIKPGEEYEIKELLGE